MNVPIVVLNQIVRYLNQFDIVQLAYANRNMYQKLIKSDRIWKILSQEDLEISVPKDIKWREFYNKLNSYLYYIDEKGNDRFYDRGIYQFDFLTNYLVYLKKDEYMYMSRLDCIYTQLDQSTTITSGVKQFLCLNRNGLESCLILDNNFNFYILGNWDGRFYNEPRLIIQKIRDIKVDGSTFNLITTTNLLLRYDIDDKLRCKRKTVRFLKIKVHHDHGQYFPPTSSLEHWQNHLFVCYVYYNNIKYAQDLSDCKVSHHANKITNLTFLTQDQKLFIINHDKDLLTCLSNQTDCYDHKELLIIWAENNKLNLHISGKTNSIAVPSKIKKLSILSVKPQCIAILCVTGKFYILGKLPTILSHELKAPSRNQLQLFKSDVIDFNLKSTRPYFLISGPIN